MHKRLLNFTIIFTFIFFPACVHTTKSLKDISINMSDQEVINQLGKPDNVLGVIKNKYDQSVSVWEYYLYNRFVFYPSWLPKPTSYLHNYKIFWFFFADGILAKIQEGEGWSKDIERMIYETEYRKIQ